MGKKCKYADIIKYYNKSAIKVDHMYGTFIPVKCKYTDIVTVMRKPDPDDTYPAYMLLFDNNGMHWIPKNIFERMAKPLNPKDPDPYPLRYIFTEIVTAYIEVHDEDNIVNCDHDLDIYLESDPSLESKSTYFSTPRTISKEMFETMCEEIV